MDKVRQTDNSKFNLILQDENLQTTEDIEKLRRKKEAAEKDAIRYKDHYMKMKNDMDDLLKMESKSLKNKNELKNIIEQKNKIISELKAGDNNPASVLKEELLNTTEKLADEKRNCFILQEKLQKMSEDLQICQEEKNSLLKQLDNMRNDISDYEELQKRLTIMADKQVQLEAFHEEHNQVLRESNHERDSYKYKFNEVQQMLNHDIEIKSAQSNTKNIDDLKEELKKCKELNQNLLEQIKMKSKTEIDLQQELQELNNQLKKQMLDHPVRSEHKCSEQEEQFLNLRQLVDKYEAEKINLINEVSLLKNRLSNIEAISNDLKNQIIHKDKILDEQARENKELQEKVCRLSVNDENIQLTERHLQAAYLEKEIAIRNAADEKLKSALNQLHETKNKLHDSMNKQYELKAENRDNLEVLNNKLMIQEQKMTEIENKKHSIEQELRLISMNKKFSDCNTGELKKKLKEITQDRDKKIQVILHLRKVSDEMQLLATEAKAEKEHLYKENDCLREAAFSAKQKLNVCLAEQESQLVEIEMMREKLISLDRNASIEKSNMKKIESQLKQEIINLKIQNKELLSANNKNFHEKEMLIKNLKEYEKNLDSSNNELGKRNQDLKKLQNEQDQVKAKLTICKEKIEEYNLCTDNFLKERQEYLDKFCNLESKIKQLTEDILNKEKEISELTERHDSALVENLILKEAENKSEDLIRIKDYLKLQNDELKEKCLFLEGDLNVLYKELESAEKTILLIQEKNKNLEMSQCEMEKENLLLQTASHECANLEKDKQVLSEKYNTLIGIKEKLYSELRNVRDELRKSKEDQSKLEEQIGNMQRLETDLKEKCYSLVINNDTLTHELNQEKNLRQELYEEIENLKIDLFSIASDKERLQQEKVEFENLLIHKDSKIDSLETSNAELTKKCCDFEEKELTYKEEIKKQIKETTINVEDYTNLRNKYESLGPKLGKYVLQNKSMRQANIHLEEKINETNIELKNLRDENLKMKHNCKNIELEMNEIKSENENLRRETSLLKDQAQEFQKKQNECLQEGKISVMSTSQGKTSDDPLIVLDNLVSQVKKSSSPAAIHLLKSCKHIRELIIKEREDFPRQLNKTNLLKIAKN